MAALRSLMIIMFLTFVLACSYNIKYSKTIPPIKEKYSAVKVMDVKGCCKRDFIKNILIAELLKSQKIKIDDNANYALYLRVEAYHPKWRRYIALSAKITDVTTNNTAWAASISSIGPNVFIDELITKTISELVREMTQSM